MPMTIRYQAKKGAYMLDPFEALKEADNPALKQLVDAAWADAITHMKKKA
jgi:hypothetical protein